MAWTTQTRLRGSWEETRHREARRSHLILTPKAQLGDTAAADKSAVASAAPGPPYPIGTPSGFGKN